LGLDFLLLFAITFRLEDKIPEKTEGTWSYEDGENDSK
jgi:hypothetical protein